MPYVRDKREEQNGHFIKTGQDSNFDVKWATRLMDTQPVLNNGVPTFYIISKAGRVEMNTMDMNALEKKAKLMCDPSGRGSYKSDTVRIYLKNEPAALALRGYIQRDANGNAVDVNIEWVANLSTFAKTMKTDGPDKQMLFAIPIKEAKIFKAGSVEEVEEIVKSFGRTFKGDVIEAWIQLTPEVYMASVTKGVKTHYRMVNGKPTAQTTNYTPSNPGDRTASNGWVKI